MCGLQRTGESLQLRYLPKFEIENSERRRANPERSNYIKCNLTTNFCGKIIKSVNLTNLVVAYSKISYDFVNLALVILCSLSYLQSWVSWVSRASMEAFCIS